MRAFEVPHDCAVLIPAGETDEEEFERIGWDKDLRADVVMPRNGRLHRKAFVLLGKVFPYTNFANIERLRAAMTIGAGFVEETINPRTGEVLWYPKSWAFENMDDIEFKELYLRLIDVAVILVPRSTKEGWEEAVDDIVRM